MIKYVKKIINNKFSFSTLINLNTLHFVIFQIHMGRNQWLATDTYALCTDVSRVKSGQQIVRNLASAVFGDAVLNTHTISGKGSNKNKQTKQPLGRFETKKLLAIQGVVLH